MIREVRVIWKSSALPRLDKARVKSAPVILALPRGPTAILVRLARRFLSDRLSRRSYPLSAASDERRPEGCEHPNEGGKRSADGLGTRRRAGFGYSTRGNAQPGHRRASFYLTQHELECLDDLARQLGWTRSVVEGEARRACLEIYGDARLLRRSVRTPAPAPESPEAVSPEVPQRRPRERTSTA